MESAPEILLTPGETADILRLPTQKVIQLAKSGILPCVELPGGDVRFEPAGLTQWIDQRRRAAEVEP